MMTRRLTTGLRVRWRSMGFAKAEGGLAFVEFTLAFPLLLLMFVGTVEFSEAFAVNRKLSVAASTVSDLVAQVARVSDSDLADITDVAETLMQPYAADNLRVVITSVVADEDNNTTVGWSYAHGTGAIVRTAGGAQTLPSGLTEANSSVIMVETSYQFTPTIAHFLGAMTLTGQAYFKPRVSRAVAKVQ
jgi:Flp pilus assembly protein TadG